jgi:ATP synthase protein I
MTEKNKKNPEQFSQDIGKKAERKIKAKNQQSKGIWYGLGMSGLVGWSVTVPTIIGIFIGVWIDKNFTSSYSWTLMGLFIGIFLGCLNAWYWIEKESQKK